MKAIQKLVAGLLGMLLTVAAGISTASAATNQATDPGGGGATLTASGTVTVNSTALALVKYVFDTSGNCLSSSSADATCNGGATTITVPAGTALRFMILVRNTTAVAISDIRFQDSLDVSATGFTYVGGIKRTPMDATAPTDVATAAAIYTAANGGTALTTALGAPDDEASFVSPLLTVGAVTGQANNAVGVAANRTFAIVFDASKK